MKRLSIKITSNAKTLSSYSGLHLFSNLISKFEFQFMLGALLPQKQRDRGLSSFEKLYSGVMGFTNVWMTLTIWAMTHFL
jgi:hypothetical protein